MTYFSNTQPEIILRKDREWSLIDSELCLVTDFLPLMGSTVKDGIAISSVTNVPYASINIECKKIKEKITGFICHKMDFAHLWAAFRERGVNEEKEEVLIYWSTKHYKYKILKILSASMLIILGATHLPKIVVMVCPKGTYESRANGFKWPPKQEARLFVYILVFGIKSPSWWVPDVMK